MSITHGSPVWITKWALTQGILQFTARETYSDNPRMIAVNEQKYDLYFHKPDWHETEAEAAARAEEMRVRKLASLRSQLEKYEAMRFRETEP